MDQETQPSVEEIVEQWRSRLIESANFKYVAALAAAPTAEPLGMLIAKVLVDLEKHGGVSHKEVRTLMKQLQGGSELVMEVFTALLQIGYQLALRDIAMGDTQLQWMSEQEFEQAAQPPKGGLQA